MRRILLSLAALAGLAVAGIASPATPANAATALAVSVPPATTAAAIPAIADAGQTATVQKVYWVYVTPYRRVWRGPVVVAGPRYFWRGHYWYHRAWAPYGWRYY